MSGNTSMKKKCYEDIQRQLNSLISIIELCLTLKTEIELAENKLNVLLKQPENFKKQVDIINLKTSQNPNHSFHSELQELEFKLDSLVDDLDGTLFQLATFDRKLKNVVVLKERLEAVQEERIDGITPERIYKLLEKQQRSQNQNNILSSESWDNNMLSNLNNNIRQKFANFSYKIRKPKIVVSLSIIASLFLGWTAGYYSSINVQLNNNKTVEATKKLNTPSVDI